MGGYDDASLLSTNARARGFTNARRPFSLVSESVSACRRRHPRPPPPRPPLGASVRAAKAGIAARSLPSVRPPRSGTLPMSTFFTALCKPSLPRRHLDPGHG